MNEVGNIDNSTVNEKEESAVMFGHASTLFPPYEPTISNEESDNFSTSSHYQKLSTSYLNNGTTPEESMAIEALSELGTSRTIFSTTAPSETNYSNVVPPLPCPKCDLQFETTGDLQKHRSDCSKNIYVHFKCELCSSTFDRKLDLNNHLICHSTQRPHSCRLCGTLFLNKKSLISHVRIHDQVQAGGENHCRICGVSFTRSSSLTNHMKIHNYLPGRAVLIKPKQNKPLPSISNIKIKHAWNSYNNNNNLSSQDSVTQINQDGGVESRHVCIYCKKSFDEKKALISHLNFHIILRDVVQCEKCNIYFSEGKKYENHLKNCTTVQEVVEQHKSVPKSKHLCNECNKCFATKQKLQRHTWIHRKKVFTCEICAYTFELKEELDHHRLASHKVMNAYICNICGKSFSSKQGRWEHNRLHNPTPQLYDCKDCKKTFTSRQGYLIHKRIHSNERPYGCQFCLKAFRDGGTLRKHERIHTGERPHSCPLCNRAFNQKVVLREHVRSLHSAYSAPNSSGTYNCSLCDQVVQDKDELCAHIVKHSDNLKKDCNNAANLNCDFGENCAFVCELCDQVFVDKNELNSHVHI